MPQMETDSEKTPMDSGSYRKTIGYRLQHAARLHRTVVARGLANIGLYPGQEQVLKYLHDNGETSIGALAEALSVRPPTISKTIARLSGQNLIERSEQAKDARVVMVSLTEEGTERARALDAIWFEVEEQIIAGMDSKDVRRLRKALRRVERQLGGVADSQDLDDND